MSMKLAQLKQRIDELEKTANVVQDLALLFSQGQSVQPLLQIQGQEWYRGSRELLVKNQYSGLPDFDSCYKRYVESGRERIRWACDIEQYLNLSKTPDSHSYKQFSECFTAARALLLACTAEIKSRELPIKSQLSFEVADEEFTTATEILESLPEETLIRAAGVIARVAVERHIFTVANTHSITVIATHKKATAQDALNALAKHNIITAIQKSELESLFKIGNTCAHPKEIVTHRDVERLIKRGRELAAVIC